MLEKCVWENRREKNCRPGPGRVPTGQRRTGWPTDGRARTGGRTREGTGGRAGWREELGVRRAWREKGKRTGGPADMRQVGQASAGQAGRRPVGPVRSGQKWYDHSQVTYFPLKPPSFLPSYTSGGIYILSYVPKCECAIPYSCMQSHRRTVRMCVCAKGPCLILRWRGGWPAGKGAASLCPP